MKPDISVVIRDGAEHEVGLSRCLASLCRQSIGVDRMEVLVAAESPASCVNRPSGEDAAGKGLHIRAVDSGALSAAAWRDKAVHRAKAERLAFIDADCEAHPLWIEGLLCAADEKETDLVGGPVEGAWESPPPVWLPGDFWPSIGLISHLPWIRTLEPPQSLLSTNLAMGRKRYLATGPLRSPVVTWNGSHPAFEGYDYCLRVWKSGGTVRYAHDAVVYRPILREEISRRTLLLRIALLGRVMAEVEGDHFGFFSRFREVLRSFSSLPVGAAGVLLHGLMGRDNAALTREASIAYSMGRMQAAAGLDTGCRCR